jgi:hypothetical protein
MVFAIALYDVVLFVHILAVVVAFGTSFAYPLIYAIAAGGSPAQRASLHAFQARYGRTYASLGLLVVILAGAYLASDGDYWSEPWVGIPLLIAIIVGGIGGGYLGPREARLAALAEGGDQAEYRRVLGQARAASLAVSGLVLVAIFLMTTKLGA